MKERPKEERTAVASGIAVLVMAVLFLGWALIFFKKIASGAPVETEWGPRTDLVQFESFEGATEEFTESYFDATEELRRIRDESARSRRDYLEAEAGGTAGLEVQQFENTEDDTSGFGF